VSAVLLLTDIVSDMVTLSVVRLCLVTHSSTDFELFWNGNCMLTDLVSEFDRQFWEWSKFGQDLLCIGRFSRQSTHNAIKGGDFVLREISS
jgi:hypothetical protein